MTNLNYLLKAEVKSVRLRNVNEKVFDGGVRHARRAACVTHRVLRGLVDAHEPSATSGFGACYMLRACVLTVESSNRFVNTQCTGDVQCCMRQFLNVQKNPKSK